MVFYIFMSFAVAFLLYVFGLPNDASLIFHNSLALKMAPIASLAITAYIHLHYFFGSRGKFINSRLDHQRLMSLTWQEFEEMSAEYFKKQGFRARVVGGGGADGGIDVLLDKGSERHIVQCKHWKTKKVGVPIVREIYGLMHAHRATGAKVVSTLGYTKQAYDFAKDKRIELISGSQILAKKAR